VLSPGITFTVLLGIEKLGIGFEVSYKIIKYRNYFTIFIMLTLICGVTNILEP